MKTGKFYAVLMTLALLLSATCLMAEQDPSADVIQAATEGLPFYLNKIPADSLEQYGFVSGDDLTTASLGTPFLLHKLTPAALEKYRTGMTVASVVTPTTMWYFPVLIAGQPRAILVVDRLDNKWQAVSLGYAGLAKELGALSRQWKAAQGYHPMLIVVFQAKQYLFTVPEKDAYNLTRMTAAKAPAAGPLPAAAVPFNDYANLGTADAVIGQLKPVVQNALKGSK